MTAAELIVGCLCVLISIAIIVESTVRTGNVELRMRRERNLILSSAISTSMLILFPILFYLIVGMNNAALLGLCWATSMVLYDLYLNSPETRDDEQSAFYSTSTAANVTVGASWACGSLIAAISNRGLMAAKGAKILLTSLVLSVAFILSMQSKSDRSKTSTAVRTAQRNMLHLSVGLFISGVLVSITGD